VRHLNDFLIKKETYETACTKALEYSATIRTARGVCLTDDLTVVRGVASLYRLISRLVKGEDPAQFLKHFNRWGLSKFGVRLLYAGRNCSPIFAKRFFPNHRFHPLIELFWKHVGDLHLLPEPRRLTLDDAAAILARLERVRLTARTKAFRRKRNRHVALVRKNTRSLLEYIEDLFLHHGRLLVVRLDLGYALGKKGQRPEVSLAQACKDRERFFNYLRRKCPLELRGYAWKLEDGRSKGYHNHVLLFFDGYKHWNGIDIACQLGEQWQAMTANLTTYWNCNADAYFDCGVGIVGWKDGPKLRALFTKVAPYLTKGGFLIRHSMKGVKTFSTGKHPKPPSHPGRPRQAD
jgi:hypothetical protein